MSYHPRRGSLARGEGILAASGERRRRNPEARELLELALANGGQCVSPQDGAAMVLVRAGDFFMGRAPGDIFAPEDQLPGRVVRLRSYLIDREPVTNERYSRFVAAGGYVDPHYWSPSGWAWRARSGVEGPLSFAAKGFDDADKPAAGVSWFEAFAYARWAQKELPTEAQWEKAARGADGRLFPWGEKLPRASLLNFNSNVGHTTRVGSYPEGASPYGCVDMAGNVNNWCRDWYWAGFYDYCNRHSITRDPCLGDGLREKASLSVNMKSDRGGGYATSFANFEVLATPGRLSWPPGRRHLWNGFRCVVEA